MIASLFSRIFPHRHNWQTRGVNTYGAPTYRLCLKCRETQGRVSVVPDRWEKCDPIPELDNQFDSNDNFIFRNK